MARPRLTVAVPVRDEAAAIEELQRRLDEALGGIPQGRETIWIDDASADATAATLSKLAATRPDVKVIRLDKRSGKAAALELGAQAARGRTLVAIDGDLQYDPLDIPSLLYRIEDGWDVVCGARLRREDPLGRRLASRLHRWLVGCAAGAAAPDIFSGLRAFSRRAVCALGNRPGWYRLSALAAEARGLRVCSVPVRHHPRGSGLSRYGLADLAGLAAEDILGALALRRSRAAVMARESSRLWPSAPERTR